MCEKEQKRKRLFCTAGNLLTTIASRIGVINKSDYRTRLNPNFKSKLIRFPIPISIYTVHINQMKLTESERVQEKQQIEC